MRLSVAGLSCRLVFFVLFLVAWTPRLNALVISEIHYHPGEGSNLEFVEITNDTTTPEDLSGYRFGDGIAFVFPNGTMLRRDASIVICADVDAVVAEYGIANAIGNFTGRLDGNGERLSILNQVGIEVESLRYRDKGKWPAAPDGTGHTLSLRGIHLDSGEPENWAPSAELGGTPGRINFESGGDWIDTALIEAGEVWRYRVGSEAFSAPSDAWIDPDFDDQDWESGAVGIGYGDGDDTTVLADMRNSYVSVAIRKVFQMDAESLQVAGELTLGIDFDDGFCAFLNGVAVAQTNCSPGQAFDDVATSPREAGAELLFPLPRNLLVLGDNVLAVLGRNFTSGSSDFSIHPRLFSRQEGGGASTKLVFNELFRGDGVDEGWVEIFNAGVTSVDLVGATLTDDVLRVDPYIFPALAVLPAGGFLVLTEGETGLDLSRAEIGLFLLDGASSTVLLADKFDRVAPPGASPGEYAEARFPDGNSQSGDTRGYSPPEWVTLTPTPGAPNDVPVMTSIVINEIYYHAPEDRLVEFLELYNRSAEAVNLGGWRFTKGIDLTFEEGTSIAPGEYLVLSNDPVEFEAIYGGSAIAYVGSLANAGENIRLVDDWGNVADEVRYSDGGDWPVWADGRGSSLELIDPLQDNSFAMAWAASDETDESEWEQFTFRASQYVPAAETEMHLFLIEKGACLIDDIDLKPTSGGANHISNPGFETSTSPWRIEGTHIESRRVTYDAHSGSACLELDASGKGDTSVNRIEIDTTPRLTRNSYDVSLWARWLRGTSLIILHGEFTPGPFGSRPGPATNLSGNTLASRFRMTIPENLGSPGAENGARIRLREDTGSNNFGPLIRDLLHSPPSPQANQSVNFTASVSAVDGISSVELSYRTGSAQGVFESVEMLDDGSSADGAAGDGVYGAALPGWPNREKIVFYIEARDNAGASNRYPPEAPERVSVLQVQGDINAALDVTRLVIDDAQLSELSQRRLHSNKLVDGSFVFNNEKIWHNIGTRYRGSPWGRPGRSNYRIRFPRDDLFHRGRKDLNLSSRGSNAKEGCAYYLVGRAGRETQPAPTADYFWVRSYINGSGGGVQAIFQPVDGDFMEKWYGEASDGPVLKASGRLAFNDGGSRTGWDGAHFVHMNNVTENYRGYYFHSVNQTKDDWEPFIELTRIMRLPNAEYDQQISSIVNVEGFFRVIGPRVMLAGWDAFGIGNGHNGYLAYHSIDQKWAMLPFDMDNSMGDTNFPLTPSSDPAVRRLMSRAATRRIYLQVLADYMQNGYWDVARADAFLQAVQADVGIGTGTVRSFVSARRATVMTQLNSQINAEFRIVTSDGEDFEVDEDRVNMRGDVPISIASVFVLQGDEDPVALEPIWNSTTRWTQEFLLTQGVTRFEFLGFDFVGDLVASLDIEVSSSVLMGQPRINAWNPSSGLAAGGDRVTILGANFEEGIRVFFGDAEGSDVQIVSGTELSVLSPEASAPISPAGFVDLRVDLPDGQIAVAEDAYGYEFAENFVRGDSNGDSVVDVSDSIRILLHLFDGSNLSCLDAADFDDDGSISISDSIAGLNFLFRQGAPPSYPFPLLGGDLSPDALDCP